MFAFAILYCNMENFWDLATVLKWLMILLCTQILWILYLLDYTHLHQEKSTSGIRSSVENFENFHSAVLAKLIKSKMNEIDRSEMIENTDLQLYPFRMYYVPSSSDDNVKRISNLTYPTPLSAHAGLRRRLGYSKYTNISFNWGIHGIGTNNFMSYAAHFCKNEAQEGTIEIISVGSGDGSIDRAIMKAYHGLFGKEINITLVDIDPEYKVDFRTVDDLIKERPNVIGNCCLLIMWPEPSIVQYYSNTSYNYDIDSIHKLKPWAVLTLYETTGISGSDDFRIFLNKDKESDEEVLDSVHNSTRTLYDLYAVEEVVYQEVHFQGINRYTQDYCWYRIRLAKVRKII